MRNNNKIKEAAKRFFTSQLMGWNQDKNKRNMPWKGEKDPYKIWLSEVMLQQTRVSQGLEYYNRFVAAFPTIVDLANASDEKVFKMWEGLGYYSRCRNLLYTARYISYELGGKFPDDYSRIIQLKGVGPYTAAAIASFAYNQPYAVLDGNVFRVISRYTGIETPIDTNAGKMEFGEYAQTLLDKNQPGLYNQAIMDFGATVCKPAAPFCGTCLLSGQCVAFQNGQVNQLPVKSKTIKRTKRWFTYFIFHSKGFLAIRQRRQKDIWQGLNEFYLFETEKSIQWTNENVLEWLEQQLAIESAKVKSISAVQIQQLTHQQVTAQFIHIDLPTVPVSLKSMDWIQEKEIGEFAFPRIINAYLEAIPNKKVR